MTNANEKLSGFSGTEHWYRYPLTGCTFTDGVYHMATEFKAYWLIDLVFSYQCERKFRHEGFQVWRLEKLSGNSYNIIASDAMRMRLPGNTSHSAISLLTRSPCGSQPDT